jgi:hypothetical protein
VAVRTAYAPVAATVLTAANLAKLPGGWIGYAEATASQNSISTITDLTSLSVTVTAGSSRRLLITVKGTVEQAAAEGGVTLYVRESSTTLDSAVIKIAAGGINSIVATAVVTPSSGSHSYKASLATSAGTVNLLASSGATASILVEDIGPSS